MDDGHALNLQGLRGREVFAPAPRNILWTWASRTTEDGVRSTPTNYQDALAEPDPSATSSCWTACSSGCLSISLV